MKKKFRSDISRCEYTNATEWNHQWQYLHSETFAFCQVSTDWCSKCGTLRYRSDGKIWYKYPRVK